MLEINAMLYCRGLQVPGYQPNLFDVTATVFQVFDKPPVTIRQIKLK